MFCSACGAQVQDTAAFCPNCGTRLSSSTTPTHSVAVGAGIEHFDLQTSALGLFFRSLGAGIGMALVVPAPWIVCWFARWFISQVRLDGQPRLSFRGSPASIAPLAIAFGLAILVALIPGRDAGLTWWQALANLAVVLLGYLFVRWFVNNTDIAGSSLQFDGSFWGYLGWLVFIYVSVITIIGWAWVGAAYYRWLAKHSRKAGGELRFVGKGHQLLWRTLVYILFCIPVVTIPWSIRWLARWAVQQFELDRRAATA